MTRFARLASIPGPTFQDRRGRVEDFATELWTAFHAQDAEHFAVLVTRMLPPLPPIVSHDRAIFRKCKP